MRGPWASASIRAARGPGALRTRAFAFFVGAVVAERRRDPMSGGRRFGRAYQGAFEAVFAIVIGAGLGYAVDRRFETEPIGVLVGLGLGFGAFVLRLLRLGREFDGEAPGAGDGPQGDGGSRGER